MKVLHLLDEYLEEYFLVASLVLMVVVIFLQVVMRYVFQKQPFLERGIGKVSFSLASLGRSQLCD